MVIRAPMGLEDRNLVISDRIEWPGAAVVSHGACVSPGVVTMVLRLVYVLRLV